LIVLCKFDLEDSSKEFLEMSLDDNRVLGLTKDLKQIIISDEVES
jgi:hypothetical protein